MTDVQVTLSLPVLKVGSSPGSGPTVIEHLQLMLNQRGGFPILTEDGEFVRLSLGGLSSQLNQLMTACLKAAIAAGDAHETRPGETYPKVAKRPGPGQRNQQAFGT